MDALFVLGQLLCLAALGYGAWVCLACAGRYDAESMQADAAASRAANARAHAQPVIVIEPLGSSGVTAEASLRIRATDAAEVAASS